MALMCGLLILEEPDIAANTLPWTPLANGTFTKLEDHVWQGTLVALASFSEGKLVNQLKSAALLSPVAYLSHITTPIGVIAAKAFLGEVGEVFVLPSSSLTDSVWQNLIPKGVRSGVVTKFNYKRPNENIIHYGQVSPPIYNLSNIPHNLPLFMSYGGRDALSDVMDVRKLLDDHFKFHDEDKLSVQFIEDYAHADFIMAVNAKDIVYNNVTAFFKRKF
ncbi:Alpha/Beta hydrolase fold [Sesbania bispinosa]|nr:Alpha/Beta hydrolase fold [Sesbania bispinosa]